MQKFRHILRYAKGQGGSIVWIAVLSLASVGLAVLAPWPLKLLIDGAVDPAELPEALRAVGLSPMSWAVVAGVAVIVVGLIDVTVTSALSWVWTRTGQSMVYRLSVALFDRLQRLSLSFHRRANVGDLLNRLSGDTYCVYEVTESLLITPCKQLLTIVAVVGVAWWLDPLLTTIIFSMAPVLAVFAWFFGPRIRRLAKGVREARSAIFAFVQQVVPAVAVIQVFNAGPAQLARYRTLGDGLVRETARGKVLDGAFLSLNGLTTSVGLAAVLVVGGRGVIAGSLSIGSLLVFMRYARTLQGSFHGLLDAYSRLRKSEASVDRVVEVLESADSIESPDDPQPMPALGDGPRGRVDFESVTFGYTEGEPVLRGVDLRVGAGESLAIVGPTGAGKTTLASLIPRFHDPWSGTVRVEGIDVKRLAVNELRSRIAVVPQQPLLMPVSIADNIRYGHPEASDATVMDAARRANADAFIRAQAEGYATVLTDRGANLSGGQRQRIAIARAILVEASVIILDEPTSALDVDAERHVMDALHDLTGHVTWVVIAHRLSTARRAQRIAVLDAGRVSEAGSHEELLACGGLYARYHDLQSSEGGIP